MTQYKMYFRKAMQQKLACATKLCVLKVSKNFSILYILNYTFFKVHISRIFRIKV